jgi:2,3,4,5-tetrahydropyridine-2-carboxylate N-succinyltransferase
MIEERIIQLYSKDNKDYTDSDRSIFFEFIELLNKGEIRACEKKNNEWVVNYWIKQGIILGFRMGTLEEIPYPGFKSFFDKGTIRERLFSLDDGIRIVPGGTSVRNGCFIASGVTIMPPAFVNIGAYVDSGTMIDSHALVGSCAQIGKRVHLSAGAMIGGVLEPIGSRPVIVEDDSFIGGNTGIYEGVQVCEGAVIASGTILTSSTHVYDAVNERYLRSDQNGLFSIPKGAVVVPGSRALKEHSPFQVYCPIIIKYRDSKTDISTALEYDLR